MKFKITGTKKIMIALDEEGKKIWYYASQKAYDGAKKYLKEGDEVEIQVADEEKEGLKVITFIKKAGQPTAKNEPSTSDKPTCKDCGVELKDKQYTTCYTCNQKKPAKPETSSSKSTSIEKQNVNNAVSRTLIALQGQVDVNNILGLIDTLWDKYYSKLK